MIFSFPATPNNSQYCDGAGRLFAMRCPMGRLWSLKFPPKWQECHCEDGSGDENENVASEQGLSNPTLAHLDQLRIER